MSKNINEIKKRVFQVNFKIIFTYILPIMPCHYSSIVTLYKYGKKERSNFDRDKR